MPINLAVKKINIWVIARKTRNQWIDKKIVTKKQSYSETK